MSITTPKLIDITDIFLTYISFLDFFSIIDLSQINKFAHHLIVNDAHIWNNRMKILKTLLSQKNTSKISDLNENKINYLYVTNNIKSLVDINNYKCELEINLKNVKPIYVTNNIKNIIIQNFRDIDFSLFIAQKYITITIVLSCKLFEKQIIMQEYVKVKYKNIFNKKPQFYKVDVNNYMKFAYFIRYWTESYILELPTLTIDTKSLRKIILQRMNLF